jgi:hypothetical protein
VQEQCDWRTDVVIQECTDQEPPFRGVQKP